MVVLGGVEYLPHGDGRELLVAVGALDVDVVGDDFIELREVVRLHLADGLVCGGGVGPLHDLHKVLQVGDDHVLFALF